MPANLTSALPRRAPDPPGAPGDRSAGNPRSAGAEVRYVDAPALAVARDGALRDADADVLEPRIQDVLAMRRTAHPAGDDRRWGRQRARPETDVLGDSPRRIARDVARRLNPSDEVAAVERDVREVVTRSHVGRMRLRRRRQAVVPSEQPETVARTGLIQVAQDRRRRSVRRRRRRLQ